MRVNTETISAHRLADYIRAHGIEANVKGDKIRARDVSVVHTPAGRQCVSRWVTIEADYREVRAWLGY